MSRTPIRTIRRHMKILAQREDYLHGQLEIPSFSGRDFVEEEAQALGWAIRALTPLVRIQEAKVKREQMEQSSTQETTEVK